MRLIFSHGSQVLSPKYDVDAYMATLFGGEVGDLYCESWLGKKLDPTLITSPENCFA
jgi:hypothetical protein